MTCLVLKLKNEKWLEIEIIIPIIKSVQMKILVAAMIKL